MAGEEPRHRDWIKLWIKESLLGSIRDDLTPEERSVWFDFLLLGGNCKTPGVISANETTALPTKRIAGILNIPEALVNRCIKKFEQSGRIKTEISGVIHIVNWARYQYTDYDRVKKYRHAKTSSSSPTPAPPKPRPPEEPMTRERELAEKHHRSPSEMTPAEMAEYEAGVAERHAQTEEVKAKFLAAQAALKH